MIPGPASHRCTSCDTNWPSSDNYQKCPVCLEETWKATNETPLTPADANKRVSELRARAKLYEQFEAFYAEREVKAFMSELDSPLC